ncbi:MAG TPA: VWA domain-containing protein, partial [Rubrobacter sp.]|nr:VWA domain-containing protein [Rubrobacter sp.]
SALMRRSLRKIFDYSPAEQRETEAAIRRIARQIHGAKTRRLKQDRTGHISVPHTLRRNVRYEGIPFKPVLRRHHEKRPRVVMLCDVSMSTRNMSRFWLHMVYQMQSLFSKVRTFVFVADVAEVTQFFEESSMDRAVDQVFSGRVLDADVNSDFGKAAEQFRNEYLPALNHRTTLVILGDGRNNGKPPNAAALEEITQHVRQTVWITPEPKWGWSLGSCDMPLYELLCDRVEVVRSVDQLAGVAEELVRVRS